jgi:hypothetical protein
LYHIFYVEDLTTSRSLTPRNPLPIVPSRGPINPDLHSDQRRRLNTSPLGDNYAAESLDRAIHLLEDEFEHREEASLEFPPDISPSHIRASIRKLCMKMRCRRLRRHPFAALVETADIHRISDDSNTIDCLRGRLDDCGRHGDDWQFCSPCHATLRRGKCPNFRPRVPLMSALSVRFRRSHRDRGVPFVPPGRQDSEVTTRRAALTCFFRIEWPYDRQATGS